MADDETGWLTIAEAARLLRVTPTAIRNRMKRGTIESKPRGSHGFLVRVAEPDGKSGGTVSERVSKGLEAELKAELERMRSALATLAEARSGEIAHLRQQLVTKDQQLAATTDLLRARDEEIRRVHVLLQAEQQQVRQLADQRQQDAPAAVPWWRRWFRKE